MPMLVFKGGNALDMVYGPAARASMDLDFSIDRELRPPEREDVRARIERRINEAFWGGGYAVDAVAFRLVPGAVSGEVNPKVGGYEVEVRYRSKEVAEEQPRSLQIEISKWEYCGGKRGADFEGLRIFVYTPRMIVMEKLRAICQQTAEYMDVTGLRSRGARARDFFDIHTTMQRFGMDLTSADSLSLLRKIFFAKDVPLRLLAVFPKDKELHRQDFDSLQATIRAGTELQSFDFYFERIQELAGSILEALGIEESPSL